MVLDSEFEASLHNLTSLSMKDEFMIAFPELASYVYQSSNISRQEVTVEEIVRPEEQIAPAPREEPTVCWVADDLALAQRVPALIPQHAQKQKNAMDTGVFDIDSNMDMFFGNNLDDMGIWNNVTQFAPPFSTTTTSDGYFEV